MLSFCFASSAAGRFSRSVIGMSLLLGFACTAPAATITVTSASDSLAPAGTCSLRGAINAVNTAGGALNGCTNAGAAFGTGDTIVFDPALAGSTITFASPVDIQKNLAVDGGGHVTLDGNHASGIFTVSGGTALTVANLHFQNGRSSSSGAAILVTSMSHLLTVQDSVFNDHYSNGGAGAIWARSLAVSRSTFSGNTADGWSGAIHATSDATISASAFDNNHGTGYGGAVSTDHDIAVTDSIFNGNTAIYGGAVFAQNNATISGSTFSGNSAVAFGGAVTVYNNMTASNSTFIGNYSVWNAGGAIYAVSSLIGTYLTLVNNDGQYGAAILFDGNGVPSNKMILKNSLIVSSGGPTSACYAFSGTLSGETNIEWWAGTGNQNTCNSTSPVLVPGGTTLAQIVDATLADHGGLMPTLALPAGSPAIDAGSSAVSGFSTDQRGTGYARVFGSAPDLGAFEYGSGPGPTPPLVPDPVLTYPVTQAFVTVSTVHGADLRDITGLIAPRPLDIGQDGAYFVFAYLPSSVTVAPDTIWYLDSGLNWRLFTDCRVTAAYHTGNIQVLRGLPIIPVPTDLTLFKGAKLYFGYGLGGYGAPSGYACNDMIARGYYKLVYTVE